MVDQPDKVARLGQISQEVKALDDRIASQQATYKTLQESYNLAKDNYQQAFLALETVRENGAAMLKAIEAHKQALALRDEAQSQDKIDTSFLNDLQNELSQVQAEIRTDDEIENDLDATSNFSVDSALSKMDEASVDNDLMAEFKAASSPA